MALGLALAGIMVRGGRFAEVAAVCSAAPRGGPSNRNCGAVAMAMAVAPPQQRPGADSQGARARRCALLLLQSGHGSQSPTTGPVRGACASAGRHVTSARAKQHGRVRFHRARASSARGQNSTGACASAWRHVSSQSTTARGRALLQSATLARAQQQHGGVYFYRAPQQPGHSRRALPAAAFFFIKFAPMKGF